VKRRELLQQAGALGAALVGSKQALAQGPAAKPAGGGTRAPASDRIRVGAIGVGNFGTVDVRDFMANDDVEVVAVCDVFKENLEKAVALTGGKAKAHSDYRRLLDDKEIDAVIIATPEQWHAIMCIDACDAGKDVYVEKPASHHIRDGRLMVDAARRKNRVVQVGSQQRSGAHFQRAVRYIQEGRIGQVYYASCWNHSPPAPPRPKVTGGPPPGMDWDMWLGPAAKLSYDEVMTNGRNRYSELHGGMLTEWGVHLADIVLWAMKVTAPETVVASGGQYFRREGDLPDTLQVTYKFPKFLFHYSVLSHNSYGLNGDVGAARFGSYGMQFQGTKGTLFIDRAGFRITPQTFRQEEPNQPPPMPTTDSRQPGFYYTTEILPELSDSSQQHPPHVRNFLDCCKSRKRPNADIEIGHHTNTLCRLGNISYRVGRLLRWDAAREQVIGDSQANKLAVGAYRSPWKPRGI
jgi:predicted dehydrogenase